MPLFPAEAIKCSILCFHVVLKLIRTAGSRLHNGDEKSVSKADLCDESISHVLWMPVPAHLLPLLKSSPERMQIQCGAELKSPGKNFSGDI